MYIYSCEHNWEAMLTCIYEAWTSRKGHENIKLVFEPIEQFTLLDQYVHVDADEEKAGKVSDAIIKKISPYVYNQLLYTSMACEEDVMDVIYRVMILGFYLSNHKMINDNGRLIEDSVNGTNMAREVLNMVQYKDVMRYRDIYSRVSKEVNMFQEFVRFNQVSKDLYVSHIEPKSRIVVALGPIFEDRMPSENFVIVDDIYKEAVIHMKDNGLVLKHLTDEELLRLKDTEEINDEFTDMWKSFFKTISIKERENPACQRSHAKIWARKHMTEFN